MQNDKEDNADSNNAAPIIIAEAIKIVVEMSLRETGGKWLEEVTVKAAPHIKEWDVAECWLWDEWPEREKHFPNSTKQDIGIDVVAKRKDGEYIAIQCKSRKLDEQGEGGAIGKDELNSFISASVNPFWSELWIVTNGANSIGQNAEQALSMSGSKRPIKLINIKADLDAQKKFDDEDRADSEHLRPLENPEDANAVQTKNCMQKQAIAQSVRILKEHAQSNSGGLPIGQARGKIILPCGTGKTRISLRIVEELTKPGGFSIVLCPSIALVAQIRREYLQNAKNPIRALAVCSDETAGYSQRNLRAMEDKCNTAVDPTLDVGYVGADIVKGKVSTNPADIAQWIESGQKTGQISVIFGTYQSGRALADALQQANAKACVLIADEAHRTAGLRRKNGKKKDAKNSELSEEEQRVRDFTLCHDNEEMPATYRVYQTATPRIYDLKKTKAKLDKSSDWIVRSMDDEETFGVDLFRKSYLEAVHNNWLSDYRIIALGVNDPDAYEQANKLARETESKGKQRLSTSHYLRGMAFALAMGGEVEGEDGAALPIQSCIAFMNTVDKSKNMAKDLPTKAVREWIKNRQKKSGKTSAAADNFKLEHLDASSNVTKREEAKRRLADATPDNPHGIINVGIFGEGTDSPSLSAVAFLESRKSPIDVVQAVGRAMRTSPGKQMGYIICPILIPPSAEPEKWISTSNPEDGWKELGQILLALRAHDNRIEDQLKDLLHLYLPQAPPPKVKTFIGITTGKEENRRTAYREYEGKPGEDQKALERVLKGESSLSKEKFQPLPKSYPAPNPNPGILDETQTAYKTPTEPNQIITGKTNNDESIELRIDSIQRDKPATEETLGKVNIEKSKKKAHAMINKGEGQPLTPSDQKPKRKTAKEAAEQRMLTLIQKEELQAITMNLLAKSGLTDNRIQRDLNILEESVKEAAHHLKEDQLQPALDRHFELDNIKEEKRKQQADGCAIAALLMMNAAMLHQRIAKGQWMKGIISLSEIKNATNPVTMILRQWNDITRQDFLPVIEPAVRAIRAIEDTGKLAGLERALRHLASEAERIAETYADMGADHAGILFNKVMGNQASDGAFFTRPPAADLACRLTLDVLEENPPNNLAFLPNRQIDWTAKQTWRALKIFDPAVGSGTLLAAMLAEMKRRARFAGADEPNIAQLQRLAVEQTLIGMDINPVSLQLAAAQLTLGNRDLQYRNMRLHLMPYGPQANGQVKAGALELLSQKAIVQRHDLGLPDAPTKAKSIKLRGDSIAGNDPELQDAVEDAQNCPIVICNPPFTNRVKMGEKFKDHLKKQLREQIDGLERMLVDNNPEFEKFMDKNALSPLFVAMGIQCSENALAYFCPTVSLTSPSGKNSRIILAKHLHVHTIITVHNPHDINLSQDVNINESILILQRNYSTSAKPTRFINLDRFPNKSYAVEDFHKFLLELDGQPGQLRCEWGEVSYWPRERIERGDWTPAIWRSPELAEAAAQFAECEELKTLAELGIQTYLNPSFTAHFEQTIPNAPGSFLLLKSKSADAQLTIQSQPDEWWIHKKQNQNQTAHFLAKAGHLLITQGQDTCTARLTALADEKKYIGIGWIPFPGLTAEQAKALAVFLNSTAGRLQLMRNAARKLNFPQYGATGVANIRVPDVLAGGESSEICRELAECWEDTKNIKVPQYRDGDDWDRKNSPRNPQQKPARFQNPRPIWDKCVSQVLKKNPLFRLKRLNALRKLLHREPHIRGKSYHEYQ